MSRVDEQSGKDELINTVERAEKEGNGKEEKEKLVALQRPNQDSQTLNKKTQ